MHEGFQRGVQINLTPTGARRLFGIPMHELTGRVVHTSELLGHDLAERLHALPSWGARFDALEALLTKRMQRDDPHTRMIEWAAARVATTDMKTPARELGYSRKHMITLFREHIGIAPKKLAQLQRFEQLVARLRQGGSIAWADTALDLGFFDPSHMIREVRRFAHCTPTELVQQVNFVQETLVAGS